MVKSELLTLLFTDLQIQRLFYGNLTGDNGIKSNGIKRNAKFLQVSIEIGQFTHVTSYVSKAGQRQDALDVVIVAKLHCTAGLANLEAKKDKLTAQKLHNNNKKSKRCVIFQLANFEKYKECRLAMELRYGPDQRFMDHIWMYHGWFIGTDCGNSSLHCYNHNKEPIYVVQRMGLIHDLLSREAFSLDYMELLLSIRQEQYEKSVARRAARAQMAAAAKQTTSRKNPKSKTSFLEFVGTYVRLASFQDSSVMLVSLPQIMGRDFQVEGTPERPRLYVFRSNKHIYVQVIDDSKMHTLASASTMQKPISEEFDYSAGPTEDGTSNYFKGLVLFLCYLIVTASFFVHIDPDDIRELCSLCEIAIWQLMVFDLYKLLVIGGAFVQGIGYFMLEEYLTNEDGLMVTNSTWTYHKPAIDTTPKRLNVRVLNSGHHKKRIISFKASGEPPLLLAATVHSAIRAAIREARKQLKSWDKLDEFASKFYLDVPAIMPVVKTTIRLDYV
ncbi:hypothetical protein CQW23_23966 [Capsicum baccatum]|uniref:Aldehyde oxidase/xanthine dehydrogenase second molybdopterin binding domain-containing protein n=1 Tax=Capsicum baccatum TaxID=33114 RepID=A0A2G2VTG8_CAPBA|nr:hypothetical protein CQW23_23966 [Capsicum baccatum]